MVAQCGGIQFQTLFATRCSQNEKRETPFDLWNKIVSAYTQNDIKLLDSYNFVSTTLSKFASIIQLEEVTNIIFPHLFNRPDM